MLNLIAAIRRKPGMSHRAFLRYVHDVHGSLAAANPLRIRRYLQNHVFDASFGSEEDPAYVTDFGRDNVTELHFEDMAALAATMSDPYSREVIGPDGANFNDMPSALALLTTPVALTPPPEPAQDAGPVKVLHFLCRPEGLDLDTLNERWLSAHEEALSTEEPHTKALRGCVQHRQAPGAEQAPRHVGGRDKPAYAGVAALYYDSADDALAYFPSYERALRETGAAGFYDRSHSFVLYAREVTVFSQPR